MMSVKRTMHVQFVQMSETSQSRCQGLGTLRTDVVVCIREITYKWLKSGVGTLQRWNWTKRIWHSKYTAAFTLIITLLTAQVQFGQITEITKYWRKSRSTLCTNLVAWCHHTRCLRYKSSNPVLHYHYSDTLFKASRFNMMQTIWTRSELHMRISNNEYFDGATNVHSRFHKYHLVVTNTYRTATTTPSRWVSRARVPGRSSPLHRCYSLVSRERKRRYA